ncbi:MAG: ATP-binding protein [Candidatus Izemoplasmatales bacterium]|nr:ATP-binding protein [Candidatus Izemoplasmatales bacterium]
MARKIENTPSPDVLMNSMRSIGYTFKTALADIIDNSISANAKNIYIVTPINDTDIFISILDDGKGMNDCDLFNAMKYGSNRENYTNEDLGRFGLGLKSASLSQCRVLTVVSKFDGEINAYQWNLDSVLKDKKWDCLKLDDIEVNLLPNIQNLKALGQGTLVIWQNFDIAYKKSGGHLREYLMDEVDEATKHIQLVFHRFLNKKLLPLHIYINNDCLFGIDPFLEDHPKTDTKQGSEISYRNSIIKIQPYILPHQNDLSSKDIEKLGGIESLRNGQGFYIYRNNRLIIYGTWFRLSSSSVNSELYKYGRIKVDIPNALDDVWEIDIKKQNASIPKAIINNLKQTVNSVCGRSKDKTSKRTKLTLENDDTKIWNKTLSSTRKKDLFFINTDSKFVTNFLNEFDDKDKKKLLHFIDILSAYLPFDDIYNSICNKNNEVTPEDDVINNIVIEGVAQFRQIRSITHKSKEECLQLICAFEPFNNEEYSRRIRELVKDE